MEHEDVDYSYLCRFCKASFKQTKSLATHVRQIHTPLFQQRTNLVCPICRRNSAKPKEYSNDNYQQHLQHIHGQDKESQHILFKSFNDFENWKLDLEKRVYCKYVELRVAKSANERLHLYRCDGGRPPKGTILREECNSILSASENCSSGVVKVEYWSQHLGHQVPIDEDELESAVSTFITAEMLLMEVQQINQGIEMSDSLDEPFGMNDHLEKRLFPEKSSYSIVVTKPSVETKKRKSVFSLASVACGIVAPKKKETSESSEKVPSKGDQSSTKKLAGDVQLPKNSNEPNVESVNSEPLIASNQTSVTTCSSGSGTSTPTTSQNLDTNWEKGIIDSTGILETKVLLLNSPSKKVRFEETPGMDSEQPVKKPRKRTKKPYIPPGKRVPKLSASKAQSSSTNQVLPNPVQQTILLPVMPQSVSPLRFPQGLASGSQVDPLPLKLDQSVLNNLPPGYTFLNINNTLIPIGNTVTPPPATATPLPVPSPNTSLRPGMSLIRPSLAPQNPAVYRLMGSTLTKVTQSSLTQGTATSLKSTTICGKSVPRTSPTDIPPWVLSPPKPKEYHLVPVAQQGSTPKFMAQHKDAKKVQYSLVPVSSQNSVAPRNIISTTISNTVLVPLQKSQNAIASIVGSPGYIPNTNRTKILAKAPLSAVPASMTPLPLPEDAKKPGSLYFESAGDVYVLEPVDDVTPTRKIISATGTSILKSALGKGSLKRGRPKGKRVLSKEEVSPDTSDEEYTPLNKSEKVTPSKKHFTRSSGKHKLGISHKVESFAQAKVDHSNQMSSLAMTSEDIEVSQKIKYYQMEMKYMTCLEECQKLKVQLAMKKAKNEPIGNNENLQLTKEVSKESITENIKTESFTLLQKETTNPLERETQATISIKIEKDLSSPTKVSADKNKNLQDEKMVMNTTAEKDLSEGFMMVRASYIENLKDEIKGLSEENRILYEELQTYKSQDFQEICGLYPEFSAPTTKLDEGRADIQEENSNEINTENRDTNEIVMEYSDGEDISEINSKNCGTNDIVIEDSDDGESIDEINTQKNDTNEIFIDSDFGKNTSKTSTDSLDTNEIVIEHSDEENISETNIETYNADGVVDHSEDENTNAVNTKAHDTDKVVAHSEEENTNEANTVARDTSKVMEDSDNELKDKENEDILFSFEEHGDENSPVKMEDQGE